MSRLPILLRRLRHHTKTKSLELGIASQGYSPDEAREMLSEAVEALLEVASEAEVRARLAEGFSFVIEPLKVAA